VRAVSRADRLFDLIENSFWPAACAFCLGTLLAFLVVYTITMRSAKETIERRDSLSAQCIAGNEHACRIYELDFGK